ncbi:uncharacterized protein LOC9652460 [Selaginella moellendorffii]|uniref:uncharacterized protein LOC9652460 n=1 Tax=Selaginella moellendorffii TaxID=88036 RepID=UPI000D1CC7E7|nr:uncharacterized protein LOC9652460 [Selaginella moellendorffii]|eukprot:XP_024522596.1 uncharacterized protein LOC9652460 [Selaginella moellendorffii]
MVEFFLAVCFCIVELRVSILARRGGAISALQEQKRFLAAAAAAAAAWTIAPRRHAWKSSWRFFSRQWGFSSSMDVRSSFGSACSSRFSVTCRGSPSQSMSYFAGVVASGVSLSSAESHSTLFLPPPLLFPRAVK